MKKLNIVFVVTVLTCLLVGCGQSSSTSVEIGGGNVTVSHDNEVVFDSSRESGRVVTEPVISTQENDIENYDLVSHNDSNLSNEKKDISGIVFASMEMTSSIDMQIAIFSIDPVSGQREDYYMSNIDLSRYALVDLGRYANMQDTFSSDGSKVALTMVTEDRKIYAGYYDLVLDEFVNVSEMLGFGASEFADPVYCYGGWFDNDDNFGFLVCDKQVIAGTPYIVPVDSISPETMTSDIDTPSQIGVEVSSDEITFTSTDYGKVTDIGSEFYIVNTNTVDPDSMLILNDGTIIDYIPSEGRFNTSGVISPDEMQIAFMSKRPEEKNYSLFIMDPFSDGDPIKVDFESERVGHLGGPARIQKSVFLLDWK